MNAVTLLLFITAGFASGSVMYSRLIPRILSRKDITKLSDDGNPGAINAFVHCGKGVGLICLTLDILKGFLPVFIATFVLDTRDLLFALVMAAPVLGHAVGLFGGFKGGKCIASSFGAIFGVVTVTYWAVVILGALYILFACVIRFKPSRTCSIVVFALNIVVTATVLGLLGYNSVLLGSSIISAIAIVKHVRGKEPGKNLLSAI